MQIITQRRTPHGRLIGRRSVLHTVLIGLTMLFGFSGCVGPLNQRALYDAKGSQVGIEADHTIDEQAVPPAVNQHPADLTVEEVRTLLSALEVSGWSGIFIGVFETPHPKPVFSALEVMQLADTFTTALHQAGPKERVYFSLVNPVAPYDTDRTAGSLFVRDGYLHLILRDHYGFQKADTGGGEARDPRDTKGMKLWVMRPGQAATVPDQLEPRWNSFDKVHLSLQIRETLAAFAAPPAPPATKPSSATVAVPSPPSTPPLAGTAAPVPTAQPSATGDGELQQQMRTLDDANLKLRSQVEQQRSELQQLKDDLRRMRDEMKPSIGSKPTPPRKSPRPAGSQ